SGSTLRARPSFYGCVLVLGPSLAPALFPYTTLFRSALAVTPLPAPTIFSPANGASGVSVQPTISFSQVTGNQGYRIDLSSNAADLTTDPRQTPNPSPVHVFTVTVDQNTTSYTSAITL